MAAAAPAGALGVGGATARVIRDIEDIDEGRSRDRVCDDVRDLQDDCEDDLGRQHITCRLIEALADDACERRSDDDDGWDRDDDDWRGEASPARITVGRWR